MVSELVLDVKEAEVDVVGRVDAPEVEGVGITGGVTAACPSVGPVDKDGTAKVDCEDV